MQRKIANLTTGMALVGPSLFLAASCSQTQKAIGEEEPPVAAEDFASSAVGAVEPRPPTWPRRPPSVQLGPRPYYLVEDMDDGPLKSELQKCADGPFRKSDFSDRSPRRRAPVSRAHQGIVRSGGAHGRGHHRMRRDLHQGPAARLPPRAVRPPHHDQHPRHSGARRQMHAARSRPLTRWQAPPASADCCTSDITLAEFKTLVRQDGQLQSQGHHVAEYMGGMPTFRTDLYATCGTVDVAQGEHRADQATRRRSLRPSSSSPA